MPPQLWNFGVVLIQVIVYLSQWTYYGEASAGLLSSTLKTYKESACEGNSMEIRCPHHTVISIQFAQFGRQVPSYKMCSVRAIQSDQPSQHAYSLFQDENLNCLASTSLRVLLDICQDRRHCNLVASTETFQQDPCPETTKYLEVSYRCRPNEFTNQTVCEGQEMRLSCQKGTRLAIYSAKFGSVDRDAPGCSSTHATHTDLGRSCQSKTASEQVMMKCHGKRHCSVEAGEDLFGNPCPAGTNKYLKVIYTCVPKNILKQMHRPIRHKGRHRKKKKKEDTSSVSLTGPENSYIPKPTTDTQAPAPVEKFPADDADAKQGNGASTNHSDQKGDKDKKDLHKTDANWTVFCTNFTEAPVGRTRQASVGLFVDWVNAFHFLNKNREKAFLYLCLGLTFGVVCLLILIIVKLAILNKRQQKAKLDVTEPTHPDCIPPSNHLGCPTLDRTDSLDRIEVVRFSARTDTLQHSDPGNRSLSNYYG